MYIDKYLTERELLNDLSNSEKQVSCCYSNAIVESPCSNLVQILLKCQQNANNARLSINSAMETRSFNRERLASEKEIKDLITKHKLITTD